MKTCMKCGGQFDPADMCKARPYCKPCENAYHREWRKTHPESVRKTKRKYFELHPEKVREQKRRSYNRDVERSREVQRQWRLNNPEKARARSLATRARVVNGVGDTYYRHGITTAQRDAILAGQGGKCAICQKDMASVRVALDHDHACCSERNWSCGGCIRGVLCTPCNLRLGWYEKHQDRIAKHLATRLEGVVPRQRQGRGRRRPATS